MGSSYLVEKLPEISTTSKILITLAFLAISCAYLTRSTKDSSCFPKWLPLEIALSSYLIASGGRGLAIYSLLRRHSGSLFGLSSKHQVIHGLPDIDRFLSQGSHILNGFPRDWTLATRVFGVDADDGVMEKILAVSRTFVVLTERLFLNEANAMSAIERADIPRHAASLVTFSASPERGMRWERSANVHLRESDTAAVEVDMFHLIRDFGACVSIPQLYGQDFLDRNESLLDDFWTFDNDLFALMMIGVPSWAPFKVVKDGVAARSRLHKAFEGLYKRAGQYLKNEPVDFGADMSDISLILRGRLQEYDEHDVPMKYRGQVELGNIWALNANTQPMAFWFLIFVYSTPDLLDDIRKEIAPHISVDDSKSPSITSFDLQALSRKCQLFKAALYETFRMVDEPTSIRYVNQSVTISDGRHSHDLKAGTWISAVHSIVNKDPSIYAEPHKFDPTRFLHMDNQNRNKSARYGRMRPWGAGLGICKGRTFAENEIFAIAAAIISLWDIYPTGEKWVLPRMRPGTGISHPIDDVRVVVKRRVKSKHF